jgi:hypothetical protein
MMTNVSPRATIPSVLIERTSSSMLIVVRKNEFLTWNTIMMITIAASNPAMRSKAGGTPIARRRPADTSAGAPISTPAACCSASEDFGIQGSSSSSDER